MKISSNFALLKISNIMDNDIYKKLEEKRAEVLYSVLDLLKEALDDNDMEQADFLLYAHSQLC